MKNLPLIIFCGLSGSGKSFNARKLKQSLGGYDLIGPGILRERLDIKTYSRKDTPMLLAKVIEQIENNHSKGVGSIVDANLKTVDIRQFFYDTAKGLGINVIVVETHCSSEAIRERMDGRVQITAAENPKDFSVHLEQKKLWQDTGLDLELDSSITLLKKDTKRNEINQIRVDRSSEEIVGKIIEILKG